jgi:hypothetical protein
MLPLQFFGQNVHFAVSLAAALVFFAVFWLYFDAWMSRREAKELWVWLGFLLVSVSYLIHATVIDQGILGRSIFGEASDTLGMLMRLAGFVMIIFGEIISPLEAAPKTLGLELGGKTKTKAPVAAVWGSVPVVSALTILVPVAALGAAAMYWRRATRGLERHLRPVAVGLGLIGLSGLAHIATLWRNTEDPILAQVVAPFGVLWVTEHVLLTAGSVVMGLWVWQYLTKRLQSQLFMILTGMVMGIYVLTTVSFTFLLLQNVQSESLGTLETAGNVLRYAIDSKKAETGANAEALAQNGDIAAAVAARDHARLTVLAEGVLEAKKVSDVVITSDSGQVLLRASDPERWGDSLSGDALVKRALVGAKASTLVSREGVLAPALDIATVVPVRSGGALVGSVTVNVVADNAFVDGIRATTGLDSAVYSGNVRSAATFTAPDGVSRAVGVKEQNAGVKATTLKDGKTYKGVLEVSNRSYLAVYTPLKDVDNTVVGMLFIGRPQIDILQAAGRSIELTFIIAVSLLFLSIWPVYYVSRYLARQLK